MRLWHQDKSFELLRLESLKRLDEQLTEKLASLVIMEVMEMRNSVPPSFPETLQASRQYGTEGFKEGPHYAEVNICRDAADIRRKGFRVSAWPLFKSITRDDLCQDTRVIATRVIRVFSPWARRL